MKYDLHIHSCLSPCANDDMTPATIAGLATLSGADIIAIADHNSALNLPTAKIACDAYGIKLLPAIEVTTQEEIHILCYFKTVEQALDFGKILYDNLPEMAYDKNIWGKQLVMDENDVVLCEVEKLLTSAVNMDLYAVCSACAIHGGIAVPAHVEKDSTSILSVLAFLPLDIDFPVLESRYPEKLTTLIEAGFVPNGREIITSSDAHCLNDIACCLNVLPEGSALLTLIN